MTNVSKIKGQSIFPRALTFVLELPFLVGAVLALDALPVVVPPVAACTPN
jgi:hypothetical protein